MVFCHCPPVLPILRAQPHIYGGPIIAYYHYKYLFLILFVFVFLLPYPIMYYFVHFFYFWYPCGTREDSRKAGSYGNEKLIRKWTRSVFFCFFSILWEREWSRFVWPNPFERFVTRLQTDFVPRFVCTSDTKLQTDFARGATITTFGQ